MNNMKFALFALMVFGMAFAGLSISSYTLFPEVVEPGTSGFLQITVSNTGTMDTVESVSITVSSTSDLGIDRSFLVGDLDAGSSVMVSLPFSASETIKSGFYTVEVKVLGRALEYYYESYGSGIDDKEMIIKSKTSTFDKRASIPVQVVRQPVISISLSEESLEDMTMETFTFTNSGGPAQKLKVTILNEGIGFMGMDQVYLPELGASSTYSTTIDARGAEEGATKLRLQLVYQNELGYEISEVKEIPVTIKKAEGNFVFEQKNPVVTGENENLQITLTNEGKQISDLRIKFQDESVQFRGLNEFKAGDFDAGASKTLTVPMIANLPPGTQNVVLQLSWVESGENRMGTVTIPLEIISDSTVGVYLEAKPAPLQSGAEHTISVTVSNLGSYKIEGTTVELESEALTLLTIQPQQFIGGLESDDFSSVQYKVRINNMEPGNYPATVKVFFRDTSGRWVTVTEETMVAVAEPAPQEGSPLPLILGVAILAAVIYWWLKRKKK